MVTHRIPGVILVAIALTFCLARVAPAQTTKPAGVTGSWKWSVEGFGGQQETVLKLKQDGDKLTGTMTGFGGEEAAISEGKVTADGQVTFKVVRDFGGRPVTQVVTGKVTGDSFKGKSETVFAQEIDAKREVPT